MRNLRKKFRRPKKPWNIELIEERKALMSEYGLRRAKEIYVARELLRGYRERAKRLIAAANEAEKKALIGKLAKYGMLKADAGLDDVLALDVKNVLERRLQTVVFKKGMATSPRHARQLIVHGRVSVSGRRTVFPSYLVMSDEEAQIGWFRGEPKKAEGVKGKRQLRQESEPQAGEPAKEGQSGAEIIDEAPAGETAEEVE
jgi:small subunit ribosomal protein S4